MELLLPVNSLKDHTLHCYLTHTLLRLPFSCDIRGRFSAPEEVSRPFLLVPVAERFVGAVGALKMDYLRNGHHLSRSLIAQFSP